MRQPVYQPPLTDEELQAIRQRCEEATAEPLATIGMNKGRVAVFFTKGRKAILLAKYYGPSKAADAKFASRARNDILRLVAEVERLRAESAQFISAAQ